MIARRIVTVLLFFVFLLVLELNQNTIWGWALLLALTVLFFVLWETGIFRKNAFLKIGSWLLFFAGFAGILFLTWPPMKRVPAVTHSDPVRTEVVSLRDGRVRGVLNASGDVEIYAGIPYAAPPVGELRWKEPEDPKPWDGVLEADAFAPMGMQPRNLPIYYSLAQIIGYHDYQWFNLKDNYEPAVSEDCLYVNVWKPAKAAVGPMPVLVYIHGGTLKTGQPWYQDYSGENLAKEGIVVVNLGYRLGVYGYLGLEELSRESANATTGNYGLLDQIKALRWVKDNISSFGGDPENITVAGESAGAASVSAIAVSPLAKGLFQRIVLESSTLASKEPPHSYRSLEDALVAGEDLKALYGVGTLAELRALPASKIVGSSETEHYMTIDGYALTEKPYDSYRKGIFNETAILHGYNSRESGPFLLFDRTTLKNFEEKVRAYFGELSDEVLALYPAETDEEAAEYWAEIYGAVFFDYPHYCLNRLAVENGIPVYEYYFSKQNGRLGSWHSGEEVYFYGNIPEDSKLYDENDRGLMRTASKYLMNFVKTGDPNGETLPVWPENVDSRTLLELGEETSVIKEAERKQAFFGILDRKDGFGETDGEGDGEVE